MIKFERLVKTVLSPFQRPEKPEPRPGEPASTKTAATDVLAISQAVAKADAPAPGTLSAEERTLQVAGLLPANYAELKAVMLTKGLDAARKMYRQGKEGPFSTDFGNPLEMLKIAQRLHANPELCRMAQEVKKGDIILETYNKPDDPISKFTNGPFVHARICVSDARPPEFIEAVGITGSAGDPTTNRVRYSTIPHGDNETYRIVRPTEGMAEPQKSHAIEKAVRYAQEQLGKPYDYAFTDKNRGTGVTDAYYCSELAYLAYASPEGANLNVPISKSGDRDEIVIALNAVVDALGPDNKAELMDQAMKLVKRNPKPTPADMVAFLVDEVMTKCKATEKITQSPEDRDRLKKTLVALMEGKAFPNMHYALDEYHSDEAKGKFDTPVIGWGRQQKDRAAIGYGFAKDMKQVLGTSGLDYSETLKATWDVLGAVIPHSAVLASFLYGPKDGRTQAVDKVLDGLDWVKEHAPDLPLIGDLGIGNLPERAEITVKNDFVSPTDLAWADLTPRDYNVLPGHPVDRAQYEAANAQPA